MAAADITRAQLATLFGSALTSITLDNGANGGAGVTGNDLRGKWCAFVGDDGGTPKLKAFADSYRDLAAYIGPQGPRAVDEASNTGAYFICYIPESMG